METQKITRENLKKIHDVACPTWQKKLQVYATRNPFGNEIELTSEEVDEMFNASDAKQKSILNNYLKQIRTDIMSKVTSYKDACKVLNLGINESITPYERLCIIIKALNEGWYPDFKNGNEYKFYNYFHMDNGVFSYFHTYYNYSNVSVPSALYLKSSELAKYAVEIALNEYKEVYM
jgi:hypothetical protein